MNRLGPCRSLVSVPCHCDDDRASPNEIGRLLPEAGATVINGGGIGVMAALLKTPSRLAVSSSAYALRLDTRYPTLTSTLSWRPTWVGETRDPDLVCQRRDRCRRIPEPCPSPRLPEDDPSGHYIRGLTVAHRRRGTS